MMEWWCQKGIDGFRMDVISMISKMPGLPDGVVGESFKWNDRKIDLVELKQTLSKWQDELYEKAWNSLYWCNHDQPRMISRLGDTSTRELRESSAKMLGTCLHMMQGTPYVFQGEELGMTNTTFESLDDFRDIESINAYRQYTENGQIKPDDMMRYLRYKSRDNARTPMQWDDSPNAGFTEGTPWIKVNPNYKEINAKEQMAREDSVFHYYQKLIRLRKENEIIVYGKYQLLMEEDPNLYVYTRTLGGERLLVICNFRKEPQKFLLPEGFTPEDGEIFIGNYEGQKVEQTMVLRAFETMAVKF